MRTTKARTQTPWWIQSLNGQLLSPAESHVLELVFLCSKHGCCMPLSKQAKRLQLSKRHVRRCHNRLQELLLEREVIVFGSVKRYHPVRWKSRADWQLARSNETSKDMEDIMSAKSVQKKKPLQGFSSSQVQNEASAETAEAGVSLSQTPTRSTNRCSGEGGDSSPTPETRDRLLGEVLYRGNLDKLLELGYPRERAEKLAQIKTDHYIAKRKAEREKILVQRKSDHKKSSILKIEQGDVEWDS